MADTQPSRTRARKAASGGGNSARKDERAIDQLEVQVKPGQTESGMMAELRVKPFLRHGAITNSVAAIVVRSNEGQIGSAIDVGATLREVAQAIGSGELQSITDLLLAQSVTLDTTSTELMRKAWANAAEYPHAFDRYMNMALKAQVQSRSTLEALARMHQPREQVVRHVHVYEGGQAVVAEQLHMHGPGGRNAGTAEQPYEPSGKAPICQALSSPEPLGNSVPMPGDAKRKMSPARRPVSRRSDGEQ